MRLAEYSDDEVIEELKHRGIKIEPNWHYHNGVLSWNTIKIGGVVFDLKL